CLKAQKTAGTKKDTERIVSRETQKNRSARVGGEQIGGGEQSDGGGEQSDWGEQSDGGEQSGEEE
ncbi:MAG: hypothetical protein IKC73_01980, partial [Clostridia bacterium]|nr:hypothetical protein [Clostridia bacterium]